jgi:ABC-type nitrate/sulfonate/bicarbonate transport system substrate-binding protein
LHEAVSSSKGNTKLREMETPMIIADSLKRAGTLAAPFVLFLVLAGLPAAAFGAAAQTSMRLLYPSFAGSWGTAWIAKEAGYFAQEGLDVELVRVGGSSRMVAAMLGGRAQPAPFPHFA